METYSVSNGQHVECEEIDSEMNVGRFFFVWFAVKPNTQNLALDTKLSN